MGSKDALDAVERALGRAAIRPDVETCSGMISTRLRQRLALPVVRVRGSGEMCLRAPLRGPVVQQGPPLTSRCRAGAQTGQVAGARQAGPLGERSLAGVPEARTRHSRILNRKHSPYLRLILRNGKLVSEKPHKQGTGGAR